jgi:glycosyltransferase involved in cell wall biosynthesis
MKPTATSSFQMIDALMVSTSYPADLSDWRGLFIRHLAEALARRNDLHLRLWSPPGEMPANIEYAANAGERHWLSRLMSAGGIAHLMRQRSLPALASPVRLLMLLRAVYLRNSDVSLYHVNWLQNALPLPRNTRPLLVTVLGTDLQLLELPLMRPLLRRAFRGRRVVICPNADWMLPTLNDAFGDVAQVRFVPFGIDPAWFQVQRTINARTPAKWLCVTRLTKGKLGTLFEWCRPFFADGRRELHLFGPMQESADLPDWVHYHGPASPGTLCREWFPSAHGLITLSQHAEGRPQVMLEAMAAGLPIIASRLPAHIDLIRDGENGRICDDLDDVGRALDSLDDINVNTLMGARAREWVGTEIGTWDDCAGRYAALYRTLLDEAAHE